MNFKRFIFFKIIFEILFNNNKFLSAVNKYFAKLKFWLNTFSASLNEDMKNLLSGLATKEDLEIVRKAQLELLWANVFHDEIIGSEWLINKSFHPGRSAVGYNYLYVVYRILNEFRPKNILELGLGESTKLIGQYSSFYGEKHRAFEHDSNWIESFSKSYPLSDHTSIELVELYGRSFAEDNSEAIYAYKDFAKKNEGEKYDFISVDGPFGYKTLNNIPTIYSRVDIVECIPECLRDNFVIVFDDAGRAGEFNTITALKQKLSNNGIQYIEGVYESSSITYVIASTNLKWFASL